MTVKELLLSFPKNDTQGIAIPCDNFTDLRPVHSVEVRELLAIYILYDYKEKHVFLPQTIFEYCSIPLFLNDEYENILVPFLNKMTYDTRYFEGSTYQHYKDEMKELLTDLKEGGNESVTRDMCLFLWTQYRLLFRDEAFSTKEVVQATPALCKRFNLTYSGPLLF